MPNRSSGGHELCSLLDGHIVLRVEILAARGHYPAISVLDSLSRLMPTVCSERASQ